MFRKLSLSMLMAALLVSVAYAKELKLNVRVAPTPPSLSTAVKFSEPSGNNILDAEETGTLTITVKNDGKGDAFDVVVNIQADKSIHGLSYEQTIALGTIPAGKSMTGSASLRASVDLPTERVSFTVRVTEANGFDADPKRLTFGLKAFEPPQLIVADMGIEDQNRNSKVEPLENVEVTVRVQNAGHGDARGVSVEIQNEENVYIGGDGKTNFEIGGLRAGEFKDIRFIFYTNKRIQDGQKIPITVKLSEERPTFNAAKALNLVMNARQRSAEEIVVKGTEPPRTKIEIASGLSVDVDVNVPEGMKAGKDDVAVVIGNKHYSAEGVPAVEYADRDAHMVKEYLIATFGFKPDNIIYEEDATLSKFNEIFGTPSHPDKSKLSGYIKKKGVSRLFIYYVGHGAPDLDSQEAYFVPVDASPQYISVNGYSLQTFYANISKLPAREITIVLDSCFSGNSDKGMLFKGISPAMVKVKKSYAGPGNATLITSAAMDGVSAWYPEKRHSLFTYYFLKALQGEADADKDRRITIGEVKSYLKENVPYMARRLKNIEQTPVVTGHADSVLVTLK